MTVTINRDLFATLEDGTEVQRYTLSNGQLSVAILDQGLRICSLLAAAADGEQRECVLGFDSLDAYEGGARYMGVVVGRYANRIRNGRIEIDGQVFELDQNDGDNHLHGGFAGFHTQLWHAEPDATGLIFRYMSPHGEAGFPGNLAVSVRVSLEGDRLQLDYEAQSDRPTCINLTNHAFFNLSGNQDTALGHRLQINADWYLPVDEQLIPNGSLAPVTGTPFDFTTPANVGRDLVDMSPALAPAQGYDLCYALRSGEPAAILSAPDGQLHLVISTSEPGLQVYTANKLPKPHTAVCLETQHFPDSPNHPDFPSTSLAPGDTFKSWTCYEFRADP